MKLQPGLGPFTPSSQETDWAYSTASRSCMRRLFLLEGTADWYSTSAERRLVKYWLLCSEQLWCFQSRESVGNDWYAEACVCPFHWCVHSACTLHRHMLVHCRHMVSW